MNWKRREGDLDAELRAHLEMAAQDARERGESVEAARAAALREFGNRDLVKETTRDIWGRNPFHGCAQDVRAALRTVRKNPGFAATVVLTLALGIGANTAIFSLIDAVMLRYLPVSHPDELVAITQNGDDDFTNPIWEQIRNRQDVFSGVFANGFARFNLAAGGEAHYARGSWISGQFFSTLGIGSALGRTITPDDDRRGCAPTAVLSYDFWQRQYGGDLAILEKTISLDGHPFQILGVAARGFSGVEIGRSEDVFTPICAEAVVHGTLSQLDLRSNWWLTIIGRPKPDLAAARAGEKLKALSPAVFEATIPTDYTPPRQRQYAIRRLGTKPAAAGLSGMRRYYGQPLLILMTVVGLLLLIACANVANLLLARAAARQKEIAVRMAMGAGRWRLVRQLLTESLLFSAAGAALGVLFARWGSALLVRFLSSTNNQVSLDLSIDARVLAFTVGVSAVAAILFGFAPALLATRVELHEAMKANSRGFSEGHSRFGFGKALVAVQVAISLVLVVGAALLLSTFWKLATLDAGFERAHVLIVRTDLRNAHFPVARLSQSFEEMRARLAAIPGVRGASFSILTPVGGAMYNSKISVEGFVPQSGRDDLIDINFVSPHFFETLRTPLLLGRDFDAHDTATSARVAIMNETAARKFFRTGSPIGRTCSMTSTLDLPAQVVGVVRDAKYDRLRGEQPPVAYLPEPQNPHVGPNITFELRAAASPVNLAPAVKAALAEVNPNIALEFRTLAVQIAESLIRERLLATLSGFFGGLALLLASVGLYGVISHNMARRRAEIGIRLALGAARGRILRMALGDVALVVSIGLAAGLGASLALTKFIASFLYGVTPNDPWMLGMAAAFFAIVAGIAGFVPARKASRLDPMTALREE